MTVYSVAGENEGRRVLRRIEGAFPTRGEPARTRVVTCADSFDWRAFHAGATIEWSAADTDADTGVELRCLDLTGQPLHRRLGTTAPAFAGDLPEGPLRGWLSQTIGVRCLLPYASLRLRENELRILDRREKTIARATLVRGTVLAPGARGRGRRIPATVRILPVRGYQAEADEICRFLERELNLVLTDTTELALRIAPLGRTPGDVPQKQTYPIEAEMRSDDALRAILLALHETFQRNLDGVRRELDTEFLHDARVAVRRQRSAVGQLRGVFDEAATERLRSGLADLGRMTGEARDLDVHILTMPGFAAWLPESQHPGLELLIDELRRMRAAEQKRLIAEFDSATFAATMRELAGLYRQRDAAGPEASRLIVDLARQRIRRAHKKLIKRGSRIGPEAPLEQLHRLRIDGKKLRYLLEFFTSLFPQRQLRALIRALKGLQENLGDLNDLAVQRTTLLALIDRVQADDAETAKPAIATARRLLKEIDRREEAERARFDERFTAFAARPIRREFTRLFPRDTDA